MNKFVLRIYGVAIIGVIALVGFVWYGFALDRSILRHDTIKISHVNAHWEFMMNTDLSSVESIGGDELFFWGDLSNILLAGHTYDITYRHSGAWGYCELLSYQEVKD